MAHYRSIHAGRERRREGEKEGVREGRRKGERDGRDEVILEEKGE